MSFDQKVTSSLTHKAPSTQMRLYNDMETSIIKNIIDIFNEKLVTPCDKELIIGENHTLQRRDGKDVRIRVGILVDAVERLSTLAYNYLFEIRKWSQINGACIRMSIYAPVCKAHTNTLITPSKDNEEELLEIANAIQSLIGQLRDTRNAHKRTNKISVGWEYWDFCPFCWRITTREVKNKYVKQLRCTIHTKNSKSDDKRLRNIRPAKSTKGMLKRSLYLEIRQALMKEARGILNSVQSSMDIQEYHNTFQPSDTFNPHMIPIEQHNFQAIWNVFHQTARYLTAKSVDLTDFGAVIKALDDNGVAHPTRDKLHLAFKRAPSLARGLIIEAETWLRAVPQNKWDKEFNGIFNEE